MNTRTLFLASIASSTLLVALAGCGKSPSERAAEAMVSAATGGKVSVSQSGDKAQMTIKDDKGNVINMNSGGNVALPKDFPTDVHLPKSYSVTVAMSGPSGMVVQLHSPDTLQSLYSEYDTAMKAAGWTEAMAMQTSAKESMLTFTKDSEKRSAVIGLTTVDGGGTDLHVQAGTGGK